MTDWNETPAALQLLAKVDAAERSSDCWTGRGWHQVAKAFSEQAQDALLDLDDIRCEAVNAIADATGQPRESEDWFEAWEEADNTLPTVTDAANRARRLRMGDSLFEQAMAA